MFETASIEETIPEWVEEYEEAMSKNQTTEADHSNCTCHIEGCASEECLAFYHDVIARAADLRGLVDRKLAPTSSTPKRRAATKRLMDALAGVGASCAEVFEALADVEDAV